MQEIKKRRIVLASVLKPASEPRMFDKIGKSLAKTYEVYCIGAPAGNEAEGTNPNPKVLQLPQVKRLSLSRVLVPFHVLKKVIETKPSCLIVCTHELLFISLLAKLLVRCKVIYDIQENYYRNILYGNSFPLLFRPFIAGYVRVKEWISRLYVSHYFLAEKGYKKEMRFYGREHTVLENKVAGPTTIALEKKSKSDGCIHLLFSGTLGETTGVFVAIDLAKKLHESDKRIRLSIVGYSAKNETIELIRRKIQGQDFIDIAGGNSIVPHSHIVNAIQSSDFGIISYPPNSSTRNSIPTKLFEYLAYRLPILMIDNPAWIEICEPFPAAIPFKPDHYPAGDLLKAMSERAFFTTLPQDVYWHSEEKKLMQTMENLGRS